MKLAFSLQGVTKRYRGFKLGTLDLRLQPGIVLGLIGPNGAGKTTTLNILAGLVRPDTGRIFIFGREADRWHPSWKLDIGYVSDSHHFYEYWSGKRNLRFLSEFYPSWDHNYALELADRFNLDLKIRANRLSKGNRAKLAVIAALAHHPRLLVLDEPTSGLDPVVRTKFLDTLWDVMESGDAAVLYSTHILSDIARIADELAFLKNGKIRLREARDNLVDSWRKISFRLKGDVTGIPSVVSHSMEGNSHLVISSAHGDTIRHLREINAEYIDISLMSVDDIAVHILKGNGNPESVRNPSDTKGTA